MWKVRVTSPVLDITRFSWRREGLPVSSDLHVFRGIEVAEPGFIMGHELTGTVVEVGSAVKTVRKGDKVVSAFTTSWYVC